MGLKNTNCIIKGNTYKDVYAIFNGDIQRLGNDLVVSFNIQTTRDLALNNQPLDVKQVRIKNWDRKSDLVALAYQIAKEKMFMNREFENENERTWEENPTGWTDHIVKE